MGDRHTPSPQQNEDGVAMPQTIKNLPSIEVVDVHVGGDLHRIVIGGLKPLPGDTVLEQMRHLRDNADGLRRFLLEEPRGGHPSIFADIVVRPSHPEAEAGFIIMELMGYPVISGTNTMSTAIALLETGMVPMAEGLRPLTLEAPGGLISVEAMCAGGKVESLSYSANTPSYLAVKAAEVEVPGWGRVEFDVLWTGAFYPIVDASRLGISMERDGEAEIVRFCKDFLPAARAVCHPVHPEFGDEGPLSFVIMANPPELREGAPHRRICCYEYPKNSICRSPAGVPSTASVVQMVQRGQASPGDVVHLTSPFESELTVQVLELRDYHGHSGVRVKVTGSGWITAHSHLFVDPTDPMTPGKGLETVLG